jgi:imidazolonepropionase-like amidohydrolase
MRVAVAAWLTLVPCTMAGVLLARAPAEPPAFAIRNVTVLPMTGVPMAGAPMAGSPMAGAAPPTTIANATIVVRGDRIVAVGPAAQVTIPKDAQIVDGTGKYVIPGLIDMHTHLSKTRASAMGLFVANGVTTVRDMGGDHEELLRWRREVRAGTRVGPRMVIAGPYLEAASNVDRMRKDPPSERVEPFERIRIPIGSPEDARRVVADLATKELDFLKIRTVENRETYQAIVDAAHAHKLRVFGHPGGTPDVVLQVGQDDVEHAFLPPLTSTSKEERLALWRQFAARHIPLVPTIVTIKNSVLAPVDHLKAMVDDGAGKIEARRPYLSAFLIKDWREQVSETTAERQAIFARLVPDVIRDLREMREAGMDLFTGSDVAVVNIFPGSSLHDEIAYFVSELGMTPVEALACATRKPAAFLNLTDTGTIEAGKIADLLVLDANPLDDIRHTRRIATVVLRGQRFDRGKLDALLESVRHAPDITVDDWGRKPQAGCGERRLPAIAICLSGGCAHHGRLSPSARGGQPLIENIHTSSSR